MATTGNPAIEKFPYFETNLYIRRLFWPVARVHSPFGRAKLNDVSLFRRVDTFTLDIWETGNSVVLLHSRWQNSLIWVSFLSLSIPTSGKSLASASP